MTSAKEKAHCVMWLTQLKCLSEVRKKFTDHFKKEAPCNNSISEWLLRFRETGSVNGELELEITQIVEDSSNGDQKSIENSPPCKRAKLSTSILCKSPQNRLLENTDSSENVVENMPYDNSISTTEDFPASICTRPVEPSGKKPKRNSLRSLKCSARPLDVVTASTRDVEKPKRNSLRSVKCRPRPLVAVTTLTPDVNIKQELVHSIESNSNIDTQVDSVAGCSTVLGEAVFLKIENDTSVQPTESGFDSEQIHQLPVKCLMQEPFSCEHCSFTTLYEWKYKRHVSDHFIKTKFSCEMCPFIARQRTVLISHMLTHTKIKRLSCEFCPFESRTKGEYRAHIQTHTQPYKCQVCLYETDSESLLSSHMLACCVLIRPRKRGFFNADDDDITSETAELDTT